MQRRTTEFSNEKHRKNFKQSVKTTVNRIREKITNWNRVIFLPLLSEYVFANVRTKLHLPRRHVEYHLKHVHLILIVPGKVGNTRIIKFARSVDGWIFKQRGKFRFSKIRNPRILSRRILIHERGMEKYEPAPSGWKALSLCGLCFPNLTSRHG